MKKRLLACTLAATMILGSTAPVLAADEQILAFGHFRNFT